MKLSEFRDQYPQYNDLSDMQLAKSLHDKHYTDIPFGTFARQIGMFDSKPVDPTEGMSGLEKFAAGYGKAAVDIGRGVGQTVGNVNQAVLGTLMNTGLMKPAPIGDLVTQKDVASSRALDAPLMNTTGGKLGYLGGMVADTLPAAAIPGANTITGAGLIGAGTGLVMPSTSAQEAATNTAVGGALGAGTQAAVQGIGAAYRGAKNFFSPTIEASDVTPAAQVLQDAGVPLDRSQLTGNRFWQSVRGAVASHPATSEAQSEFAKTQGQAFNNAVLQRIGASGKEASQDVMSAAREKIGSVFNAAAQNGTAIDDQLLNDMARVSDSAARTTPASSLHPLFKNIDDIMEAADKDGMIGGETLKKIRSHLSELSKNPDVGSAASDLEDSLLAALERSNPEDAPKLALARQQYRSMRTIQGAIGPGMDRNISPLKLSNAMASKANQNASVYGLGGDQELVKLAQAGRILPEQLPNSGTAERNWLLNANIRKLITSPLYKLAQRGLLAQPSAALPAGGGVMAAADPALQQSFLQQILSQQVRPGLPIASLVSGTNAVGQ